MIAEGPANAQGSKVKPASLLRAAQSKQSEGQSDTRVASSWHFLGPNCGDMVPSIFVSKSRSGDFLHARDYSGKMLETTCPGFDRGGEEH
jgi:hypothetical protein